MTSFAPNAVGPRNLLVREPRPGEFARVAYLFGKACLRNGARFIVAERTHPVARFVGAASWWVEGGYGRFQLGCPPGSTQAEAALVLVEQVLAAARERGVESVQYAELLPDGHAWLEVLQAQGFERLRSERSFILAYRDGWTRVMRLYEKHQAQVPLNWRSDPIRKHSPEVILDLIAPHRLLPPDEVRYYWRDDTPGGFDLDMSCILFDQARPFGAFLARRPADVLYVDVQVVEEPNRRLRSLADLCLMYQVIQPMPPDGPVRWVQFRSGEVEHGQTANFALRTRGRELPPRHVLARQLHG